MNSFCSFVSDLIRTSNFLSILLICTPFCCPTDASINVTVSFDETYNDSVGNDWEFYATVNGKTVTNGGVDVTCNVGDRVNLYAQCVEQDTYPDTGEDSSHIIIHEDDLWSSFSVTQDIIVTEDHGRYAGNTAEFAVTFTFEPVE